MNYSQRLKKYIWLIAALGIGSPLAVPLLRYFKDIEGIYAAGREKLIKSGMKNKVLEALCNKSLEEADNILAQCETQNISIISIEEEKYPKNLRHIYNPPLILYYKGKWYNWDNSLVIGIVGSRQADIYAVDKAFEISAYLASKGAVIVSGMAQGIDSAGVRGALDVDGHVACVLPGGADVVYPKRSYSLYQSIQRQGLIISESPPGTGVFPYSFSTRNRIISGLADGVFIAQSREHSGTMITANLALEQGREIFALKAGEGSAQKGTNILINEGAIPVTSGKDIIKEFSHSFTFNEESATSEIQVDLNEESVLSAIKNGAITAEHIAHFTSLPINKVNALLSILEIKGNIAASIGGEYNITQ